MMNLLAAALLLQVPTDADAEAALKVYSKAIAGATTDDAKLTAAFELLETPHEKTLRAAAKLLFDSDAVRIGVISSLSAVDHPAAVEALLAAIPANLQKPTVMGPLAAALGRLGWESAAPKLNELVRKIGDDDVRESLPQVVAALGRIGSVSSIEPLTDLLLKLRQPRRAPWKNEGEISRAATGALRAITGGTVVDANAFQTWWKENQALLLAQARLTYWNKKSHERVTVAAGEKTPPDSLLVAQRLIEAPAEDAKAEGKRARKKKGNP